jgi:hypothetical protein
MKVTTFIILQSQNHNNIRLLQMGKIYSFEIQSNPNLNLNIVVKQTKFIYLFPLSVYPGA